MEDCLSVGRETLAQLQFVELLNSEVDVVAVDEDVGDGLPSEKRKGGGGNRWERVARGGTGGRGEGGGPRGRRPEREGTKKARLVGSPGPSGIVNRTSRRTLSSIFGNRRRRVERREKNWPEGEENGGLRPEALVCEISASVWRTLQRKNKKYDRC